MSKLTRSSNPLRVMPVVRRNVDRLNHAVSVAGYPLLARLVPKWRAIEVTRDVPYRPTGERAHRMDVYRPAGRGVHPALFYVHGGAFSVCSKETHRIMAYMLASNGYTVFMPNYRLGPTNVYPSQLEDVCDAFAFVLDHAPRFGGDLERLTLAGESAGANLVTALTIAAYEPRPEHFARRVRERNVTIHAVAPIYGLFDLVDMERFYRSPEKAAKMGEWVKRELRATATSYVGHPRRERALAAPLASPLRILEERAPVGSRPLPPFFTAVGTKDPLLPDARRIALALERRGTTCELHVFPGEIHAFDALLWRKAARKKWRLMHAFLDAHAKHTRPVARRAIEEVAMVP